MRLQKISGSANAFLSLALTEEEGGQLRIAEERCKARRTVLSTILPSLAILDEPHWRWQLLADVLQRLALRALLLLDSLLGRLGFVNVAALQFNAEDQHGEVKGRKRRDPKLTSIAS